MLYIKTLRTVNWVTNDELRREIIYYNSRIGTRNLVPKWHLGTINLSVPKGLQGPVTKISSLNVNSDGGYRDEWRPDFSRL